MMIWWLFFIGTVIAVALESVFETLSVAEEERCGKWKKENASETMLKE